MNLIKEGWNEEINTNRKYLIYPFMSANRRLTLICGDSRIGKDFLVLDMALHIASGQKEWHGYKVDKGDIDNAKICIYTWEHWCHYFVERIDAWEKYYNQKISDGRLCYRCFSHSDELIKISKTSVENYASEIEKRIGNDIGMLVFDYADFYSVNEKTFIEFCNNLSIRLNCNVVVIYPAKNIDDVPDILIEYPDVIISMTKNKDNTRNVFLYKDRDNKSNYPIMKFQFKKVPLGFNSQDIEKISCVIKRID